MSCLPQMSLGLRARFGWGGARAGAGRPRLKTSGVAHSARPVLSSHHPVHVTLRLMDGLDSLRRRDNYLVVREALRAGRAREGFRLVQFSVLSNHLHLVCEGSDRLGLARGIQGLKIRIARALNRRWGRRGAVFSGRYHAHALKTPREVRNALVYVLLNARKHSSATARTNRVDFCSSGAEFDGWSRAVVCEGGELGIVARAQSWLLRVGWRRYGSIDPSERFA